MYLINKINIILFKCINCITKLCLLGNHFIFYVVVVVICFVFYVLWPKKDCVIDFFNLMIYMHPPRNALIFQYSSCWLG